MEQLRKENQVSVRQAAGKWTDSAHRSMILSLTAGSAVSNKKETKKEHIKTTKTFPPQDLKARLKDEISRVQSAVTEQCSEDSKDRMRCELEVTAPAGVHETESGTAACERLQRRHPRLLKACVVFARKDCL